MYVLVCFPFHILSLTTYRASYLETDGVRWTMFSMGLVLARDNDHGVSGAEPKHTTRYRELIVRPNGIGYCRSYRNRPKACVYPGGIIAGVGVSVHPTESLVAARWSQKKVATRNIIWPHKHETIWGPSVSQNPVQIVLLWFIKHNYQITRMSRDITDYNRST